jgi:serine/threonine protein kinase
MEFISGGEIYKLLKQERIFKESYVQFYSAQILMMIEKLHSVSVIYRDLKPENILINSNGYLKLIDFGLSK